MNLAAVRAGLAATLDGLPDVRVYPQTVDLPTTGTVTAVTIETDDPYITYPQGLNRANSRHAEIRFRVHVIPGGADLSRQLDVIDRHLSTGVPASIYDALVAANNLGGVACQTLVTAARIVQLAIAETVHVAGELDLSIHVRT